MLSWYWYSLPIYLEGEKNHAVLGFLNIEKQSMAIYQDSRTAAVKNHMDVWRLGPVEPSWEGTN